MAVTVLFEPAGMIPLIGNLAVVGLLLTGPGAVLTYFGLRRFTPVRLPDQSSKGSAAPLWADGPRWSMP